MMQKAPSYGESLLLRGGAAALPNVARGGGIAASELVEGATPE